MAFSSIESEWDDTIYPVLVHHKTIHGDLWVPANYVVSCPYLWPATMIGFRLGGIIQQLRQNRAGLRPSQLEQLDAMGMIWDFYDDKFESLILPALQVYHSRKGHIKMKPEFKVPVETYYPQATWDFALGLTLHTMRYYKSYHTQVKAHWAEMQRLGFEYPKRNKAAFSSNEL